MEEMNKKKEIKNLIGKDVYLPNGECVRLEYITEEGKFIVNTYMQQIYVNYEGDEVDVDEYKTDSLRKVDRILKNPPIAVKDKRLAELDSKIKESENELNSVIVKKREIQDELLKLEKRKNDLENFTFDRSELKKAKKITFFNPESINPVTMDNSGVYDRFKIHIQVDIKSGDQLGWYKSIDATWDRWSTDFKIDLKYGFLIDKSDEEIEIISKKRALEVFDDLREYYKENANNKYLTSEMIKVKNGIIKSRKEKEKEQLVKKIEQQRTSIEKLESDLKEH